MKKYFWLLIPLAISSCFSKKNTVNNIYSEKIGKATESNCGNTMGGWIQLTHKNLSPKNPVQKLPEKYTAYTIDDTKLEAFMLQLSKAKQKKIALPTNTGCREYTLIPSETMSPELAAKFPELQSYQGQGILEKEETLRLDYDGTNLRANITNESGIFFLDPFETNEGKIYLLFNKNDSGLPKGRYE